MASFEGPAPFGGELLGVPAASPMTDHVAAEPTVPPLTPERVKQELARLRAIIRDNASLHFLEPMVAKCAESETQDSATFLSFYRLISQSLSEELVHQKQRLQSLEGEVVRAQQSKVQDQMELALAEASQAVSRVNAGDPPPISSASADSFAHPSDQAEILQAKLAQAEVQRERLLVDMQNMRNRAKTDTDVKVFKALEKFTLSLLPALDAFHQAMPTLKSATDLSSIITGIEMIHDQLQSALAQAGLQRMEVIGVEFDPHIHESIGEVETWDVPDEHIYDELQPGYLFGERLIRAAIVRLARNVGSPPATAAPASPDAATPAEETVESSTPPVTEAATPPAAETPDPQPAETPTPPATEAPAEPSPPVEPTESAPPVIQMTQSESTPDAVSEESTSAENIEAATIEMKSAGSTQQPAPSDPPTIVHSNPFLSEPNEEAKSEADDASQLSGVPPQAGPEAVVTPEASSEPNVTEDSTPCPERISEPEATPSTKPLEVAVEGQNSSVEHGLSDS